MSEEQSTKSIRKMSRISNSNLYRQGRTVLLFYSDTSSAFNQSRPNDWRTVVINISGKEFRTKIRHLRRYPHSRLGKIAMAKSKHEILLLCDGFIPGIFF